MSGHNVQVHIDDVSRRLNEWLSQLLPKVAIEFPSEGAQKSINENADETGKARVTASLHSIAVEKLDRATLNPNRNFIVTYELGVRSKTAFEHHRIYSEIYFSAYNDNDWRIANDDPASSTALPVPLRLSTKIPHLVGGEAAPPVTARMNVEMTGLGRVAGQVTSAQGIPIARAFIEAPSLGRRLLTDNNGRFVINGAPETGSVGISVTARGRVAHLSVGASGPKELAIIMAMEEEHA